MHFSYYLISNKFPLSGIMQSLSKIKNMSLAKDKNALFGTAAKGGTAAAKGSSGSKAAAVISSTTNTSNTKVSATTTSTTTGIRTSTTSTASMTPAAKSKKLEEAREYSEKGMKYLKTTLFQWAPDHLAAAPQFEKSADAYKAAGELTNARLMYVKAAESHYGSGVTSAAALTTMKASQVAKAQGDVRAQSALIQQAAEYWGLNGDLDKYGETIAKAAKELESVDPLEAKALYAKALGVLVPADLTSPSPYAVDIMRNNVSFFLRQKLLTDALPLLQRLIAIYANQEQESSMCKAMLTVTVVQLTLGDFVKANQTYLQEHLNNSVYIRSKECELAEDLVMAFQRQDLDKLDRAKLSPQLFYLDNESQALLKALNFFDMDFDTQDDEESSISGTNNAAGKLALFGGGKEPAKKITAPVVEDGDDTAADVATYDLENLQIESGDESEIHETISGSKMEDTATTTVVEKSPPVDLTQPVVEAVEDDDEDIDLT